MRKATKTIISFAVILIAGLNIIVPALAQDPFSAIAVGGLTGVSAPGLFGSMAAMSGVNISYSSTDPMNAMWDVTNPDYVYFHGSKHEASQQTPEDIYDYIEVDLGDWLAAQSNNIVKLIQDNQIDDNESGNISTPATWRGLTVGYESPLYQDYDTHNITYGVTVSCTRLSSGANPYKYELTIDGNVVQLQYKSSFQSYKVIYYATNTLRLVISGNNYNTNISNVSGHQAASNASWTSGNINTNVFNGWEAARVKIPRSAGVLSANWTPSDFIDAINTLWANNQQNVIVIEDTYQPVPPTPTPLPTTPISDVPFDEFVDLWGTQITNNQETANDKLDFIGSNGEDQLEELQDIEHQLDYTNSYLEDIAGDTAHISAGTDYILQDLDNIDTNVGDIEDAVGSIDTNVGDMVSDLDNIDTNITSIESTVGSIDTNVDDLTETAESIDTNIGVGNGILGGIRSLVDSAVDYLEGIAEHVGELVEEIVEGTETLIAGILNQIPQVFSVIFGPIKQASSIWHYVVEWIQSIGAPFQFIWSMASGTSYYIILPVYASLAAAVVLAFYKRFGK